MMYDDIVLLLDGIMRYAYEHWMFHWDDNLTPEQILEQELDKAEHFDKGNNAMDIVEWLEFDHEAFEDIAWTVKTVIKELKRRIA